MPRRDGTGPDGQGSKTGRGLGKCNPDSNNADPMSRKGRGSGQGPGRGAGGGGQGAGRGAGGGGGKGRGRGGRN
jgi:hypothetical protein